VDFKFNAPGTTTYFCATVTDSSVPQSVGQSTHFLWQVNDAPSVKLKGTSPIEAGDVSTLTATPSGGITPLMYQWFIGAGCVAANAVTPAGTSATYSTGVLTASTTYSVLLTDSSEGTPALSSCASFTVAVSDGPQSVTSISTGPFAGLSYVGNPSGLGVSVISSDSNQVVTSINIFANPVSTMQVTVWGVAADPANGVVYVSGTYGASSAGVVCTINIATNAEGPCVSVGTSPEGIGVNSGLGEIFVANNGDNTVSVLKAGTLATVNLALPVGAGPMNVAVDPNTFTVFVTDNSANTISIIQPQSASTFAVTTATVGFEPVGVAVNPLTDNVFVTNSGTGTVSVLDGISYATLHTITVGGSPAGIGINTAANTALVSDSASGKVIVINLTTWNPLATTIPVGASPSAISVLLNPFNSLGEPNLAYVANSGSNTVSVINLASGAVIATIVV